MSEEKKFDITTISATIEGSSMKMVFVKNHQLVPPPLIPYLLSCYISSYLNDCIRAKIVKEEDVDRFKAIFVKELQKLVVHADKYITTDTLAPSAIPDIDPDQPLRFEFT